jgi:phage protein D
MNDNGTPVYYASRPVISIDGQVDSLLGDPLLTSLLVEETTRGLFRCEARFRNWSAGRNNPYRFFDGEILDFGKSFKVELGQPNQLKTVFEGRIMGLEGQYPPGTSPEIVVLAEDTFQDLRMERHTRTFTDASDGDAVHQIASDHGLTADVDVDGPTYKVLSQLNQSDLAFLRERACTVDAELWLDERTIHFVARNRRDGGSLTLTYGANLRELNVLADLAHQRTAVHVTGWNVADKQAIDERVDDSILGSELGRDRSGATVLAEAIAEREETVSSAVPLTAEEAGAQAKSEFRRRARQFVTGEGVTDGEPDLRVGATVTLEGLGPWFDGDYYVTRVRHVFDLHDGYRTYFDVERPGLGQS